MRNPEKDKKNPADHSANAIVVDAEEIGKIFESLNGLYIRKNFLCSKTAVPNAILHYMYAREKR
jgi:hypothetical protein